ncbi:MAG: cytochrome C oxidase subunit I, partial [Moraxellaceae bacterium]
MNKRQPAFYLLVSALVLLLGGLLFGALGGVHYILPGALREVLPFAKLRPLHVSMVVFWLLIGASGCIYYIMREQMLRTKLQRVLAFAQATLVIGVAVGAIISYSVGVFGGREYWEFPPYLAIPLSVSWVFFGANFLMAARRFTGAWPIYYWQWLCGICFFLFSLAESYLWLLPFFGDHIVRDMTVQWKSYGAIVGSWNMLIYGTAFYLMEKISGDARAARKPLTFFFFFLGLFNLMFNWGHHIYVLPVSPAIKHISYVVTMTELLILGKIIYDWKASLTTMQKNFYRLPYRFLAASDVWIFLNLALALVMSVPAFNL